MVGPIVCSTVDGMGSSGHVVGRLHVKNLDILLSVRGQCGEGGREGEGG